MEIAKNIAVCLQAVSVTILGLTFLGIRSSEVPRILQPLFLVPWYIYAVFFVLLLAFVLMAKKTIVHLGSAPQAPSLQKVDTVPFQGVNWDILAPAQHPQEKPVDYARRLPDLGQVRIPPKCPKCGVELEEKKALLFWHTWRCVACGFKKRNRDPFATEAVRAGKIWRGKAEAAAAGAATAAPAVPASLPDQKV